MQPAAARCIQGDLPTGESVWVNACGPCQEDVAVWGGKVMYPHNPLSLKPEGLDRYHVLRRAVLELPRFSHSRLEAGTLIPRVNIAQVTHLHACGHAYGTYLHIPLLDDKGSINGQELELIWLEVPSAQRFEPHCYILSITAHLKCDMQHIMEHALCRHSTVSQSCENYCLL